MDLIGCGVQWLADQQLQFCSEEVTWSRGNQSCTTRAIRGRVASFEASDASVVVGVKSQDFLIPVAELEYVPAPGDRITAGSQTFEVLDVFGDGCWQWADPHKRFRRIHVKEMETP